MKCPLSNLSQSRSYNRIIYFIILILTILNSRSTKLLDGSETLKKIRLNSNKVSFDDIVSRGRRFNTSSHDLIVLLHIQKTGGTAFEKHLVEDLTTGKPCGCNLERRRCNCPRPSLTETSRRTFIDSTWLLSRFSTGWICGLHPDWTSLSGCLSAYKQLYFVTFLRNPIERFVSEIRHVQRGATWKMSKSRCQAFNTQLCYEGENWSNVTIEEFMNCSTNMATNRQTRMLADLDLTLCPESSQSSHLPAYETALLLSAMNNLRRMAFFGLCEEQRASQILFEKTFGLKFNKNFEQSDDDKTRIMIDRLPSHVRRKIAQINHLDMDLYQFAVSLFQNRLQKLDAHNLERV